MDLEHIKCLIIDDDPFIRELLQDKLDQYFPEVTVLSTACSGYEGLEKIAAYQPELVFLDVEMTDMTGFEMLAQLNEVNFQTIFITSYSHYAIKAIRFNALDYLLKPLDLGELKKAILRYKRRHQSRSHQENMALALQNIRTKDVSDQRLLLKTQDGELRLLLKDIIRIEGDRNYSYIHLKNGGKKLVTKTLLELEELVDSKGFYRCHRSHIVNALHIVNYSNGLTVLLSDTMKVPVSRRKKKSFQQWMEALEMDNL